MRHQGHFEAKYGDTLDDIRVFQELVARFLRPFAEGADILDIGASEGHFQFLFKDISKTYLGIDPNPRAPAVERATIAGTSGRYDLIIYCHVLEHVEDPISELRMANGRLKQDGRVFVAVPYGTAPWAWEYDSHLWLFREDNLKRIAQCASLRVQSMFKINLRRDCEELWAMLR